MTSTMSKVRSPNSNANISGPKKDGVLPEAPSTPGRIDPTSEQNLPTGPLQDPAPLDSVIPKKTTLEGSEYLCGSITDADGTYNPHRLWPNGQTITYRFIDGHKNQHDKVIQVGAEWSRYANIKFNHVKKDTPPSTIVISFATTACWGFIGRDVEKASDRPFTMALGAVSDSIKTTHNDRAVILHQFGHVLGLVHEHMCPSETNAVALKQELIIDYYKNECPEASVELFDTYINGPITNYAAPDLNSVMVYAMPRELNEGSLTIERNSILSPLDKAFMVINYPRLSPDRQASEWTLRHALLIANVDEHTMRAIAEEHNVAKRRILFADYLSAARKRHSAPLVDPAPKIVLDLTLPAVQDALREFFAGGDKYGVLKELRADSKLMQELKAVMDRLSSYHTVREVVQAVLPPVPTTLPLEKRVEINEDFTHQLVELVTTLYTTVNPHSPTSGDVSVRANAVTALCIELARHETFRHAMKQALLDNTTSPPQPRNTSDRPVY